MPFNNDIIVLDDVGSFDREEEPASWLDLFFKPPVVKTSALMKKFPGLKQAVGAVAYSFNRRQCDPLKEQKPIRSFLVVDPSCLYWEEFARTLSHMLFDTKDVVRIALSQAVDNSSR